MAEVLQDLAHLRSAPCVCRTRRLPLPAGGDDSPGGAFERCELVRKRCCVSRRFGRVTTDQAQRCGRRLAAARGKQERIYGPAPCRWPTAEN